MLQRDAQAGRDVGVGAGIAEVGVVDAIARGVEQLDEIVAFTTQTNLPSQKVMQAIGMHYDPQADFEHPKVAVDDPLRAHVLYRITRAQWLDTLHG